MAVEALEQHKRFMRDTNLADLAKHALATKKSLWKEMVQKQRAAWMASIKRELVFAEARWGQVPPLRVSSCVSGVNQYVCTALKSRTSHLETFTLLSSVLYQGARTKWTIASFEAAMMSAEATLRPLLGELRPEDKEGILAAMCDENIVEAEAEVRETKPSIRAPREQTARENRANTLEETAGLMERDVVSKVRMLKNVRVVATCLARVSTSFLREEAEGSWHAGYIRSVALVGVSGTPPNNLN